jgi:hypothetical protein
MPTSGSRHGCFVVEIITLPLMRTAGNSFTITPSTFWPRPTSAEPSVRPYE